MRLLNRPTASIVGGVLAILYLTAPPAFAAEPATRAARQTVDAAAFVESYCAGCHSTVDPAGDREFETLDLSKSHFDNQVALQEIIDQLTLGTMPPEGGEQPSTAERLAAIQALTARLSQMRRETASTGGRTVLRRLSRREYRQTMSDLLGIDMTMFDPTLEFPGDNLSGQFDTVGDALVTSGYLLECYLDAADRCVEKAFAITQKPEPRTWRFQGNFYQQPELANAHRAAFRNRYLCLYDHPWNDKTEGGYGYLSEFKSGVPTDGIYEIRVLAKAMHRDTPYSDKAVRIDLSEPFRMGLRPGDTAIGDMYHNQPIQPKLAETTIADDEFRWYTFRVPLDRGFAPRFTFENGIHDVRGSFGRIYRLHRDTLPQSARNQTGIARQRVGVIQHGQLPHIRIDEVQIHGPIDWAWPTQSQQRLWGGDEFIESQAESQIESFASRAFRRPATESELNGLLSFYRSRLNDIHDPSEAFQDTVKAALCSPGFLYLQQPSADGRLSSHALAERLSYFLTSSMPDDRLRTLADRGVLDDPQILRSEVRRLLADEKSDAFVADFLESWLNLRDLGSMPPNPEEFWYYYAAGLEEEMKTETRLFLRDLIDRDASILAMLGGDYSFLNRDLAKLYGVEDRVPAESAAEFRRVSFENSSRGGLLGQASILTVSANGIETSPVVRGVWLLENILGTPTPPPPDDVPAIEPDTRGAVSIRDQLTKHRNNAACYQCHRKIDPLGFAFESFDAIGQERKFYDAKRTLPIDTSGMLPGGAKFEDLAELKHELLRHREFFARTVTEQLLKYALGREIEPLDRGSVDQILAEVRDDDYPAAKLIEAIVVSDLFRR